MTAVLPEAGPDAAGNPPDPEEHLRALAVALAEADRCIKQLVVDELGELWPALDQAEAQAAERLRDATGTLEAPQAAVDGLTAEITRVEGQCAEWQARLDSDQIEDRVEARVRFSAWNDELEKLKARRDFAEAEMLPLFDARNKARGDLELARGAKRGLAWSIVDPFGTAAGQATQAYVAHRQLRINHVLLTGDRAHPEWECAIAQLEELCKMTGYRTDHLPSAGEIQAAAATAAMADALTTPPDPAPSAVEIQAQTKAHYENMALQESAARNVIDDRRGARPQPVPARPSMQWQPLRDAMGG